MPSASRPTSRRARSSTTSTARTPRCSACSPRISTRRHVAEHVALRERPRPAGGRRRSAVVVTMGMDEGGRSELHARRDRGGAPPPRDRGRPLRPAQRPQDAAGRPRRRRSSPGTTPSATIPDLIARAGVVLALAGSAVRATVEGPQRRGPHHLTHRAARRRARPHHLGEALMTQHTRPRHHRRARRQRHHPRSAQHPARLLGPDGRDAARRPRPDHLQHRAAHHRGRARRCRPHAVGDHGLHPGLDDHDAGLRQGRRPDRAQEHLHRRDQPLHGRLARSAASPAA